MKIIVFDTETTGLPDRSASLEEQPYVCQFAGVKYEYDFDSKSLRELEYMDLLIKPDVEIPFDCIEVHGISNEMVAEKPRFGEVAERIKKFFGDCEIAVAHNLNFDKSILEVEFERAGMSKAFLPGETFDTMKESKELCKLPGKKAGKYKSPRLGELYRYLFGRDFENAHNAIFDVRATGECLQELAKLGVFAPTAPVQGSLF